MVVDFVGSPGEYSMRGGIIDVYPFTSLSPYRLNFLDPVVSVFRIDVNTQLTTDKINNFILSSVSDSDPCALSDVSLNRFFFLACELMNLYLNHLNILLFRYGNY